MVRKTRETNNNKPKQVHTPAASKDKALAAFVKTPLHYHQEKIQRMMTFILNLRTYGNNVTNACKATGIDRRTYYDWHTESQAFRDAVAIVKEECIDRVVDVMHREIQKGNAQLIMYYLNTQARHLGYGRVTTEAPVQDAQPQTNVLRIEIIGAPKIEEPTNTHNPHTMDIEHVVIKPAKIKHRSNGQRK